MRICHCNVMADDVINHVLAEQFEQISEADCLLEAVGLWWRESFKLSERDHVNPFSCTRCFNTLATKLQKEHQLFLDETLPEPGKNCATCPRRAQCGIQFSVN